MSGSGERRILVALATAYVLALGVLVTAPWGWQLNRLTVRLYVLFRYDWPIAPDWASPDHYGFALNVVLFVPLGVIAALLTRWSWWRVVLAAALASTAIEVVQWLFLDRVGDEADVAANTLGAALGAGAVSLLARLRSRRAGRPGRRRPR
ncbi:VanZ family protein [Nocardioides sp. SYSU D00065]|uniref:VanZ family protein n=1 Tax=Nocardioides sp. SYSU D00065 TaxID=2817378 RepID=UPI001B33BDC6|nr:VanZ family protein [Nocardioides sp. SYSU D00065]